MGHRSQRLERTPDKCPMDKSRCSTSIQSLRTDRLTCCKRLSNADSLPPWLAPVGQLHRISAPQPLTGSKTILFHYLERNLPEIGSENELQIFFSPDDGVTWQPPLPTNLDDERNVATAKLSGCRYIWVSRQKLKCPSLVADMWNEFGYPLHESQPVTNALASIVDFYSSICYFNTSEQDWHCHHSTIPAQFAPLTNDLHVLEFGRSYDIYMTQSVAFYLGIPSSSVARFCAAKFASVTTTCHGLWGCCQIAFKLARPIVAYH